MAAAPTTAARDAARIGPGTGRGRELAAVAPPPPPRGPRSGGGGEQCKRAQQRRVRAEAAQVVAGPRAEDLVEGDLRADVAAGRMAAGRRANRAAQCSGLVQLR